MNEHATRFVEHLQSLRVHNRGAMAALRRSLGFQPGQFVEAMPIVERFVARDHPSDPYRQSLYLTAGLFALNPRHRAGIPLGTALAQHMLGRDSASLEKRFVALLSADSEALQTHLRHAMQLLAADERPLDFATLIDDLSKFFDEQHPDRRHGVCQRWARDFYRCLSAEAQPESPTDHSPEEPLQ